MNIDETFVQPDVDPTLIIECNQICRTMNNRDWEYGIRILENNPSENQACVYWRMGDTESQWVIRGPNGLVARIIQNGVVISQRPI